MPAAAVIPAPIVYIKIVAVKKLVVGFSSVFASRRAGRAGSKDSGRCAGRGRTDYSHIWPAGERFPAGRKVALSKMECLKQIRGSVNNVAWDNAIGPRPLFVALSGTR